MHLSTLLAFGDIYAHSCHIARDMASFRRPIAIVARSVSQSLLQLHREPTQPSLGLLRSLACIHLAFLDIYAHAYYVACDVSSSRQHITPAACAPRLCCIPIESLHSLQPPSLAYMHLLMLLAFRVMYAHACQFTYNVASVRRPITRVACAPRLECIRMEGPHRLQHHACFARVRACMRLSTLPALILM